MLIDKFNTVHNSVRFIVVQEFQVIESIFDLVVVHFGCRFSLHVVSFSLEILERSHSMVTLSGSRMRNILRVEIFLVCLASI